MRSVPQPVYNIPVYPQPSFYETTIAVVQPENGEERIINHNEIDDILIRPRLEFPAFDMVTAEQRMASWKTRKVKGEVQIVKTSVEPVGS